MTRIIPIPTTRVGDLFIRQRLTQQAQLDQLAMFELQNQVSTGRRLQLPSDDAPAALRAINLQRLLDRKGQIRTNLEASNFYLSAAETSLGGISTELNKLRGEVLAVTGTLATAEQRQEVVQQVNLTMQMLVEAGNAKSQGRYLFAGSRSQDVPYRLNGEYVEFLGNEGTLRSYVDLERLFDTNLTGTEVFGGLSAEVKGSVDLNPHLSANTLVSTINGGAGIGNNPAISLSINTGLSTETRVIDLSEAVTLDDVARTIEASAPGDVTVEITGTGLVLRSSSGPITVAEVAQGRTARELGILSDPDAIATPTIQGEDLNPAVLKTTRLSDLLGAKSQALIALPGSNNDLQLTAARNGVQFDGAVEFVPGGSLSVSYAGNTLTIQVEADSTASEIAAAITNEGTFTATVDNRDATSTPHAGSGTIDFGGALSLDFATIGGIGDTLDTTSGLILTNGGESVTLDISGAETVEDLLNLINGSGLALHAEINADRDGINVRSRLSGADFTIGENGGTTATQLGIRTYNADTKLVALNRGVGVATTAQLEQLDETKLDELQILARNGSNFVVDVSSAESLQDVVNLINNDPGNNTGGIAVLARLTPSGNGIELVDSSAGPIVNDLTVADTDAAEYLDLHTSRITDIDGNYVMSGANVLGHDLMIESRDGRQFWIDLAGTSSIEEVMERINSHPENVPAVVGDPRPITAQLATTGNGIQLVDSTVCAGSLSVHALDGSDAAHALGFVAAGQTETVSATSQLQSEDRHTLEADSVFNTLVRLREALEAGDPAAIGRAIDRMDDDLRRVNFARAEIGARIQSLEVIETRLDDENVELQAALSQEIDVDLVEAISSLTARQYAFEASLRTAGSLLQMSLLNFI